MQTQIAAKYLVFSFQIGKGVNVRHHTVLVSVGRCTLTYYWGQCPCGGQFRGFRMHFISTSTTSLVKNTFHHTFPSHLTVWARKPFDAVI